MITAHVEVDSWQSLHRTSTLSISVFWRDLSVTLQPGIPSCFSAPLKLGQPTPALPYLNYVYISKPSKAQENNKEDIKQDEGDWGADDPTSTRPNFPNRVQAIFWEIQRFKHHHLWDLFATPSKKITHTHTPLVFHLISSHQQLIKAIFLVFNYRSNKDSTVLSSHPDSWVTWEAASEDVVLPLSGLKSSRVWVAQPSPGCQGHQEFYMF